MFNTQCDSGLPELPGCYHLEMFAAAHNSLVMRVRDEIMLIANGWIEPKQKQKRLPGRAGKKRGGG